MTLFAFRAYDDDGKVVSGTLEAESEKVVLDVIRKRGLFPFETRAGESADRRFSWLYMELGGRTLGLKEKVQFLRIMAALLQAGVPIDKALSLIASSDEAPRIATAAANMRARLLSGMRFSDSVAATPGFLNEEVGLIRAGEQTGQTAATMLELGALIEARVAFREKITAQLTYPFILLLVAVASLVVITTVLVPNVTPVFEQSGQPLPYLLLVLAMLQANIASRPLETAIAGAAVVLATILFFRSSAKLQLMDIFFHLTSSGRKAISGRFCRILGTLLRHGTDLQTALKLASDASSSERLKQQSKAVIEDVTTGRKLSQSLGRFDSMDAQALQLIAIGEETNRLDHLLLHIAASHDAAVARMLERIATLMTPVLTVLIGLLVGGLIMSVMRAILSLNELAL